MNVTGFNTNAKNFYAANARITQSDIQAEQPDDEETKAKTDNKLQAQQEKLEKRKQDVIDLERKLKEMDEQNNTAHNKLETQSKCQAIALRILSGDKVPDADHRFLAENDPGLYKQAIMFRKERKDPIKYKRLSSDEDNENDPVKPPDSKSNEETAAVKPDAPANTNGQPAQPDGAQTDDTQLK